jgi:hypothetical protein
LWCIDEEGLDTMWDRGEEDPCLYHHCIGYDINLLKECFKTGNRIKAKPLLDCAFYYLPQSLIQQINELASCESELDLYKEWKLSA